MDNWGPRIAEMRAQSVPWKDIQEVTGLGSGPAYVAWKHTSTPTDVRFGGGRSTGGSVARTNQGTSDRAIDVFNLLGPTIWFGPFFI